MTDDLRFKIHENSALRIRLLIVVTLKPRMMYRKNYTFFIFLTLFFLIFDFLLLVGFVVLHRFGKVFFQVCDAVFISRVRGQKLRWFSAAG